MSHKKDARLIWVNLMVSGNQFIETKRNYIPFENASVNISSVQNGKLSIRLSQLGRTCILHPLSTIIANTCQY